MSDLHVVAVLEVKPGTHDTVRTALEAALPPSRAEPGCISYELYTSNESAATFVTIETWRAQADLDAHMERPHIKALLEKVGPLFAQPPVLHLLSSVDAGGS